MGGDGIVVGAEGELEFHFVGDDVAFGAAVKRTDGDDGGGAGLEFAADDGLEREDDFAGEDDGVLGGVRPRAVAADAADEDVDGIDIGGDGARHVGDGAGREASPDVHADDVVGYGKTREESVGDHGERAGADFFGGLGDQDEGAGPTIAESGEHARGAEEGGDMGVVGAGVHRGGVFAGEVFYGGFAGVGHAGFFQEREGIHVLADEHGFTGAVFQDADDAGVADVFGDLEAEGAELFGDEGGGARLHERELGVGVEIFIDGFERGVFGGDFSRDGVAEGGVGGQGEGREGERGEDGGEEAANVHGEGGRPTMTGRLRA